MGFLKPTVLAAACAKYSDIFGCFLAVAYDCGHMHVVQEYWNCVWLITVASTEKALRG